MKAVIAGGRDYQFSDVDIAYLDALHKVWGFTEIVSGGASGADACGELWAQSQGIPVKVFKAQWRIHGNSAGPIRNKQMADYIKPNGVVVLFPGGHGTDNMRETARKMKLTIVERIET